MKTLRQIAGVILLISGILHAFVYLCSPGNTTIGLLVFGVLYFVVGLLLFGKGKNPLYLGIIVPLTGMTLSLIKMGIPEIISWSALFKLLSVSTIVCCCIVLLKKARS
jgi:hypothetical protein